ncbi:T3SS effector EspG [Escherichia coli]|uniref:EspG domain-containing protein n=1 Tax=Escherichia coli TaxID=562 RepID=UPI000DA57858|nr:EspG domain-containing protein [Escherichia coli]SQM12229.1 T3SS effector EspG [Escherichia coli]SQM26867.1 T3SS effector EspG [Escherichia coli]
MPVPVPVTVTSNVHTSMALKSMALDSLEHFVSREATWNEMSLGEKFLCIITMGLWKPMVMNNIENEYLNNFRSQLRPGLPCEGEKVRFGADFSDHSRVVIAIMDNGDVRMGCQSYVANIRQQGDCELTYRFEGKEARAVLDLLGPVSIEEPARDNTLSEPGSIFTNVCKVEPFALTAEPFADNFCDMSAILGELRLGALNNTGLRINGYEFSEDERRDITERSKTTDKDAVSFLRDEINAILENNRKTPISSEFARGIAVMCTATTPAMEKLATALKSHEGYAASAGMEVKELNERYGSIEASGMSIFGSRGGFSIKRDLRWPLVFADNNGNDDHTLMQTCRESLFY